MRVEGDAVLALRRVVLQQVRVDGDVAQREVPLVEVHGKVLVNSRGGAGDSDSLRGDNLLREVGASRERVLVVLGRGLDVQKLEHHVHVVGRGVLVQIRVRTRIRRVPVPRFVVILERV